MDILELFEKFDLQTLPREWIELNFTNNFSEEVKLPENYEMCLTEQGISIGNLIMEARFCIFQWLYDSDSDSCISRVSDSSKVESTNKTWQILVHSGVQHKALLCLLNALIQEGKSDSKNESRQLCLKAIGLYFLLLAIPGSNVFHVFNSTLYSNAIESLKAVCKDIFTNSKDLNEYCRPSDGIGQNHNSNYDYVLKDLVSDFIFFINRFKLNDQQDSLVLTIEILICITKLETKTSNLFPSVSDQHTAPSLSYVALKDLCNPAHGVVSDVVLLIMQMLIRGILIEDTRTKHLKEATVIKDHSVMFISYLLRCVGEPVHLGAMRLVENLCVKSPDRADERGKNVQSVYEIMTYFPDQLYLEMEIWIMKLSHNDSVKNRITGLELVAKLLYTYPNQRKNCLSLKFLLGTVFSRMYDISFNVQTKALSVLGRLISSTNNYVKEEIERIFINLNGDNRTVFKKRSTKEFSFHDFIRKTHQNLDTSVNPLPDARSVIKHLEVMLSNSKASVSKSTFQALTNIFVLNEKLITINLLENMKKNCLDPSVSVRIQFIQSMTDLLICYPSHKDLLKYWILAVLPLIHDTETRSQEKALQALQSTFLDNIVVYDKTKSPIHFLPWKLMTLSTELKTNKLLGDAFAMWTNDKCLRGNLLKEVFSHIETEHNDAAWCLLSYLSQHVMIKDPKIIQRIILYFHKHVFGIQHFTKIGSDWVTEVLFLNLEAIPRTDKVGLMRKLSRALNNFEVPLILIQRYMDMCHKMTENFASTAQSKRDDVKAWAVTLIQNSEEQIEKLIGTAKKPKCCHNELYLAQVIFTLAEAIHILPREVNDRTIDLIENIMKRDFTGASMKETVQAVVVVFLGRLALQEESRAKEYVLIFGNLLRDTRHEPVKTNAMIALVDLCMRFTSMVEGHIPELCLSLRDPNIELRRKTLKLLVEVICQDFLKLRCPLFFYLLIMLNDKDEDIRQKIRQFFVHSVVTKNKNIMYQHFIESLFYYNACYNHLMLHDEMQNIEHNQVFSLNGAQQQPKRRQIYRFMLEHMLEEHKCHLNSKLCTGVLDKVINGTIPLNENGNELVRDVFYLLTCEQMNSRPQSSTCENNEDEIIDDENVNDERAVTKKLKSFNKCIVSKVVKKNTMEVVVPILVHLKSKLEQARSHLLQDLRNCLRLLMKDHKNEVNEILSADEELAAEINFDLQHLSDEDEDSDSNSDNLPENEPSLNLKQAEIFINRLTQAAIDLHTTGKGMHNLAIPSTSKDTSKTVLRNTACEQDVSDSASLATSIISIISTHQQASTDLGKSSLYSSAPTTSITHQPAQENFGLPGPSTSCTSSTSRPTRRIRQPISTVFDEPEQVTHYRRNTVVSTSTTSRQATEEYFGLPGPSTSYSSGLSRPPRRSSSRNSSTPSTMSTLGDVESVTSESITSKNNSSRALTNRQSTNETVCLPSPSTSSTPGPSRVRCTSSNLDVGDLERPTREDENRKSHKKKSKKKSKRR